MNFKYLLAAFVLGFGVLLLCLDNTSTQNTWRYLPINNQIILSDVAFEGTLVDVELGEFISRRPGAVDSINVSFQLTNAELLRGYKMIQKSCECVSAPEFIESGGQEAINISLIIRPNSSRRFEQSIVYESQGGKNLVMRLKGQIVPQVQLLSSVNKQLNPVQREPFELGVDNGRYISQRAYSRDGGGLFVVVSILEQFDPAKLNISTNSVELSVRNDRPQATDLYPNGLKSYMIPLSLTFGRESAGLPQSVSAMYDKSSCSLKLLAAERQRVKATPNNVFLVENNPVFSTSKLRLSSGSSFRVAKLVYDRSLLGVRRSREVVGKNEMEFEFFIDNIKDGLPVEPAIVRFEFEDESRDDLEVRVYFGRK